MCRPPKAIIPLSSCGCQKVCVKGKRNGIRILRYETQRQEIKSNIFGEDPKPHLGEELVPEIGIEVNGARDDTHRSLAKAR